MSNTDGRWTQDSAVPDMEIFVGASEFRDISGAATFTSAGPGLFTQQLAAAGAGNFFANITAFLKRTGVLANPNYEQSQFGTGALQPGPSAVAGTSGPEGMYGMPPFPAAQLPTLKGPTAGAPAKGCQVTAVDVIYTVATVPALVQLGLTETVFVNNIAPAVTNRIALGANGLPTAAQALPYRFSVPVASPTFPVASGTEVIANVKLTAGTGIALFYGIVLKCAFNFN